MKGMRTLRVESLNLLDRQVEEGHAVPDLDDRLGSDAAHRRAQASVELENGERVEDLGLVGLGELGVGDDLVLGGRVDLVPDADARKGTWCQVKLRGRRETVGANSFSPFAFSSKYRWKSDWNEVISASKFCTIQKMTSGMKGKGNVKKGRVSERTSSNASVVKGPDEAKRAKGERNVRPSWQSQRRRRPFGRARPSWRSTGSRYRRALRPVFLNEGERR